MYRILLIVLLNVAISLGCRPPPCHWADAKPIENYFNQVANKVINADRKAQQLCERQGSTVLEVHTQQEYKLIVPGAGDVTYDIKVRDRVVQLVPDNCQNPLAEVKILPSYVNIYGGRYYSYKGNLEVAFPYRFNPQYGGGICEEPNRNPQPISQGSCIDCV